MELLKDIIIQEPLDLTSNEIIDDDFFDDNLFEDVIAMLQLNRLSLPFLGELEAIHDYLDSLPEIGKVLSVASGIKLATN